MLSIKSTASLIPTVLIFDLDETTHTNYKTEAINTVPEYYHSLSKSAENLLCKRTNGKSRWYQFEVPQLNHYLDPIQKTITMHAIARDEFKKIFNKIYALRQSYGDQSPIAVKIITRGEYYEPEVKKAWDRFYAIKDKRFTNNLLPVEFFNRSHFTKDGLPLSKDTEDGEFKKEGLITELFPRWQQEMPGLEKSRVCMIDNDYEITEKVKEAGFSAIHFPTLPVTRPDGVTFTKEGKEAFAAIHELIDTAAPGVIFEDEDEVKSESEEERFDTVQTSECLVS